MRRATRTVFALLAVLLFALASFCFVSCGGGEIPPVEQGGTEGGEDVSESGEQGEDETGDEEMGILLTIGGQTFTGTLADSETGRAFAALLPLTLQMSELNGNEKYFYMDGPLPSSAERVGQIRAGDLMLYGSDCVVLFYESFSTPYSYTRIGRVETEGLAQAVGTGNVSVAFSPVG